MYLIHLKMYLIHLKIQIFLSSDKLSEKNKNVFSKCILIQINVSRILQKSSDMYLYFIRGFFLDKTFGYLISLFLHKLLSKLLEIKHLGIYFTKVV